MALRAAKFDPILRFWRLRGTPQDDLKFFGGGVCVGERVRRGVASLKFSTITCENKENSRL